MSRAAPTGGCPSPPAASPCRVLPHPGHAHGLPASQSWDCCAAATAWSLPLTIGARPRLCCGGTACAAAIRCAALPESEPRRCWTGPLESIHPWALKPAGVCEALASQERQSSPQSNLVTSGWADAGGVCVCVCFHASGSSHRPSAPAPSPGPASVTLLGAGPALAPRGPPRRSPLQAREVLPVRLEGLWPALATGATRWPLPGHPRNLQR